MSQTVEELVALGLSEAEAKRVINRKAKAEEKASTSKALAEKRLPKAQAVLDHAIARAAHWAEVVATAQAKVDKHNAIISGESTEEVPAEDEAEVELEGGTPEPEVEAPKATRSRGKK